MKSPRICIFNVVNGIDEEPSIVETEVHYQVVAVTEILAARIAERHAALAYAARVGCEIVLFALVMHFKVVAERGKVIENLLLLVILVAIVFRPVLPEIGRKFGVHWVFAHNGRKGTQKPII